MSRDAETGAKALRARGVCHSYGKGAAVCEVLKDFALELEKGEFAALMGPSGSGKSTFLHLAAGLLVPDAGTIEVGGAEVTAMGDAAATRFRRAHVGVVFQAFNLVETLTVAENVALPAKLDHAAVDAARLAEILGKLGLAGREKRRPAELSGGERQRVAIARALFRKPDLVLADEPTGNLDAQSAKAICEVLAELNRTEKSAILVVTHDPQVAASAGRVLFLRDGKIAADRATRRDPAEIGRLYLEVYG